MSVHTQRAVRLSSLLAISATAIACDQPKVTCSVAKSTFSAKYTLVSGTGPCSEIPGEDLFIYSYSQPKGGDDPAPDPKKVQRLAIQPANSTSLLWSAAEAEVPPNPEDTAYAIGSFTTSEPGSDDFCEVPTLSMSRIRLPFIAEYTRPAERFDDEGNPFTCTETVPEQALHDAAYQWSNVRVYVTPSANGTQLSADLTVTIEGCTAQYKVTAMSPSVSCAAYPSVNPATGDDAGADAGDAGVNMEGMDSGLDVDASVEDAAVDDEAGEELAPCPIPPDPGTPFPDDTMCTSANNVSFDGLPVGSNINPDFMVQCHPQLLRCVLTSDPPSLR